MRRLLCILLMLIGLSTGAWPQVCTINMPNANFGTIDLTAGVNYNTTVNFTASCTGIAGRTVRICPNFNAGTGGVNSTGSVRYLVNGSNQLQYNIYRNNAYTNVWGSRVWGLSPTPPTINLVLNGAGSGTVSRVVRMRVFSGQGAVPSGIYTSSFAGSQTRVNYGYSTAGNCPAITSSNLNPTQTPFTVTATAGGGCQVTATEVDFGNQTTLSTNIDQTNTISVRCPAGVPYSIGLDGGTAAATSPVARKLSNGTDQITYGIYRDSARSTGWGSNIGVNTVAGTGSGAFQDYTAYSRIPPQTTPPPDLYEDSIVVTVTY